MKKKERWKNIGEFAILLTAVLVLAVFVRRFVLERVDIIGSSMEPTFYDNDVVMVEKMSKRSKNPQRFDVIVFFPDEAAKKAGDVYYVKRVIGLPGETVQIHFGMVYINDEPLAAEYEKERIEDPGRAAEKIVLGEDEYFVLGDNRAVSKDSRSTEVGNVKRSQIGGRVVWQLLPIRECGPVK